MAKARYVALIIGSSGQVLDVRVWEYPVQQEGESIQAFSNKCDAQRDQLLRSWMEQRDHDPADFPYHRVDIHRIKAPSEI